MTCSERLYLATLSTRMTRSTRTSRRIRAASAKAVVELLSRESVWKRALELILDAGDLIVGIVEKQRLVASVQPADDVDIEWHYAD